MSENAELQTEEVEVLKSIYEGDEAYTCLSDTRHQYKYGEDGEMKTFLLEIVWGEEYPTALPGVNLDAFYNKHLISSVREHIIKSILEEGEQYLGMSMTYSLFEWVKENLPSLLEGQPETLETVCDKVEKIKVEEEAEDKTKFKEKKERLTKSQKRRMWDKGGEVDERERGWNWVDVIKHLHQTGIKGDE